MRIWALKRGKHYPTPGGGQQIMNCDGLALWYSPAFAFIPFLHLSIFLRACFVLTTWCFAHTCSATANSCTRTHTYTPLNCDYRILQALICLLCVLLFFTHKVCLNAWNYYLSICLSVCVRMFCFVLYIIVYFMMRIAWAISHSVMSLSTQFQRWLLFEACFLLCMPLYQNRLFNICNIMRQWNVSIRCGRRNLWTETFLAQQLLGLIRWRHLYNIHNQIQYKYKQTNEHTHTHTYISASLPNQNK